MVSPLYVFFGNIDNILNCLGKKKDFWHHKNVFSYIIKIRKESKYANIKYMSWFLSEFFEYSTCEQSCKLFVHQW